MLRNPVDPAHRLNGAIPFVQPPDPDGDPAPAVAARRWGALRARVLGFQGLHGVHLDQVSLGWAIPEVCSPVTARGRVEGHLMGRFIRPSGSPVAARCRTGCAQNRTICMHVGRGRCGRQPRQIRRSDFLPERWKRPYGDHRKGRESVSEYSVPTDDGQVVTDSVRTRSACMRLLVKSLRGPVHVNLDPLPVPLHNLPAPLNDPRPKLPTPLSDPRPEGLAWSLHDGHLLS